MKPNTRSALTANICIVDPSFSPARTLVSTVLFVLVLVLPSIEAARAETEVSRAKPEWNRNQPELHVKELKTEHLSGPLGVQTTRPRFGWLLDSTTRGELQTSYQILVASSLEKLGRDAADKWDSGRVLSDNSVEVPYAGRTLTSGEIAYWKVRVWSRSGYPSEYSEPSSFEMGLLTVSDWKGEWIMARKDISSPIFRREFFIDSTVRRARAYISGLGFNELYINGKRVGERVLEPASSYYDNGNNESPKLKSRVLYSTYDVTDRLGKGSNVIGVMLGHGWYSGEVDPGRELYGDRPRFILQMHLELEDGRTFEIVSDGSWKSSSGPIIYNDLFDGETYDARMEQPGWDQPEFIDSAWETVTIAKAPSGHLTSELLPPSEVVQTLPVVRQITPKVPEHQFFDNTYIYDFGQHFTGWVRIEVSGPRGAKLTLRYGSRLYREDDTLDTRSNDTPIAGARQTDTYVLKGDGTEVWEPRFTLHGFRYVEVRGFSDAPSVQKIEGRFVRSAVESVGSFSSSNELINRIHSNIQWTFMSSFQGIMQDAADRAERVAFLGDPGFVAEDYIYNYDMRGFWEKWLDDIQDSQADNGSVPPISPPHWRTGYELFPCWQSTYPLLVWYLYQYYGDVRVLENHYSSLKKLVEFMRASAPDHIISVGLGDHMEPQPEGFSRLVPIHTPAALTSTAYYYYDALLLSEIADVLGSHREARSYRRLSQSIKKAFNRRFFDSTTNQYAGGSQTSNALALYFGLVPPQRVPAVTENLVSDIVVRHDYHVSTGIIGSNAIVQVLPQYRGGSVMYRLATQTTYPSLGHQVIIGATTVCETYECGPSASQNMKMFGSLDKYFYRNLAGIHLSSPGFRRALIQPRPSNDLQSASASLGTVRGTIKVAWFRGRSSFDLTVSIPAGMEADIDIPVLGLDDVHITEGAMSVWKEGRYVQGTSGLTGAEARGDSIVFHAGSGHYRFLSNGAAY